jgi:alpha-glucosidase
MPVRRLFPILAAVLLAGTATARTVPVPTMAGVPLVVTLDLDDQDGTAALHIGDGRAAPWLVATIGIRTTRADLTRHLQWLSTSSRRIDETYTMTTGKRLRRTVHAIETRLSFAGDGDARMDLVVRTAADGVAYRYELPAADDAPVTGERSAIAIAADARAWLLPYNPQYEKLRIQATAGTAPAGTYGYPALFGIGPRYLLVTEANSDGRYAGSRLTHAAGAGTYALELADPQVTFHGNTPWRVAIIGDLATVAQSTMVDDLADPARFTDTAWIRPGKVAWSWLSGHDSPSDLARQKQFVDFAARNHWPYVLVDEGWDAAWVPSLVAYAKARHVDILLWFHWSKLDTAAKRAEVLPRVKAWGVPGIKVDFMESDSQARYQWYDDILADTARLHLMINFHGATVPHGLARTWPQVMSMEGVRGTENDPPPFANTIQPYTRNVVGSMDFTPVALDTGIRQASIAHEVALSVVFESGWQHFADSPEAYDRHPVALAFLDQVPTVWDDTRLLAGTPGTDVAMARRSGDRWFIGAISATPARTLAFSLAALGPGPWLVDVVHDAPGPARADAVHEVVTVTTGGLAYALRENGGFAAVACPAVAGRKTCYTP